MNTQITDYAFKLMEAIDRKESKIALMTTAILAQRAVYCYDESYHTLLNSVRSKSREHDQLALTLMRSELSKLLNKDKVTVDIVLND